jgi:hypothetical protein
MLGLILIIGAIAGIIYFIKKRKSPPQNPIQSPIQPQNPIAPIQ